MFRRFEVFKAEACHPGLLVVPVQLFELIGGELLDMILDYPDAFMIVDQVGTVALEPNHVQCLRGFK